MATFDDAADLLAFASSQQTIIERETFSEERDMADIVYPQFVPVAGNNELATSITYVSTEGVGAAAFINHSADDVPLADVALDYDTKPVFDAGIGYGWGWGELRNAMAMGINLQAERAFAARRAYEEMVQGLVFEGDATRGLVGLIDKPNSTLVSAGFTGDWSAASNPAITAQEIAVDLMALIHGTGTGTRATANRLVLPEDEYMTASVTFFANSDRTALDLIQARFPGMQIMSLKALETAAGSNNKRRYLAYRYDSTSMVFHLPMALRFLPVYQAGPLRFEVPGVFRVGGLNVKRKSDFAYAEGS